MPSVFDAAVNAGEQFQAKRPGSSNREAFSRRGHFFLGRVMPITLDLWPAEYFSARYSPAEGSIKGTVSKNARCALFRPTRVRFVSSERVSMTSRYRALADAERATGHHDYDIAVVLLQSALEQAPEDSELRTELCDAHEEKAAWIARGIKAAGGNVEGVVSREIGRSLGELARIDKARADRLRQGLRELLSASDPLLDEWVGASAATSPDAMARSLRNGDTPESSNSQLHCCALLLLGTADRPLAANEGITTGDRLDEDFLIARTVALLRNRIPNLAPMADWLTWT
jgi:hypothetical protein